MEIERKYLVSRLPNDIYHNPSLTIQQGYISRSPVIRIRKSNDDYLITYKSSGLMVREEFEEKITREQFQHLKQKIDDHLIYKTRYKVPIHSYTAEVDIFKYHLKGLILVEVEFKNEKAANAFIPPHWFGSEVTFDSRYQNSYLCTLTSINQLSDEE